MKAHALKWPAPAQESSPQRIAARGAQLFSDDGRSFIDFDNSAGSILLGHADPDVEAAVEVRPANVARARAEVAERLLSFMPLAQAVYLFQSVSLARRTALDVVRNASGRDRVLTCAADTRRPDTVPYGDLEALEREMRTSGVAAILIAPVGLDPPFPSYLAGLRALADRHACFLVFDETASAFRVHEGGAQTLFNVRPDLTLVGDSMANGRPIAAIAGDPILLATAAPAPPPTATSLAAAAATLGKLGHEPVVTSLAVRGAEVQAELAERIRAHGAQDLIRVAGDPTMSTLVFAEQEELMREVWLREMHAHGLWCHGEHFISYAHGDRDVARLLDAYDRILPLLVRTAAGEEGVVRFQQSRIKRELAAR